MITSVSASGQVRASRPGSFVYRENLWWAENGSIRWELHNPKPGHIYTNSDSGIHADLDRFEFHIAAIEDAASPQPANRSAEYSPEARREYADFAAHLRQLVRIAREQGNILDPSAQAAKLAALPKTVPVLHQLLGRRVRRSAR